MKGLKIYCVLDPSRAMATCQETMQDVCWVEARLEGDGDEVEKLMASGELKGFVFRHPLYLHTVKMNDWVSHMLSVALINVSR